MKGFAQRFLIGCAVGVTLTFTNLNRFMLLSTHQTLRTLKLVNLSMLLVKTSIKPLLLIRTYAENKCSQL